MLNRTILTAPYHKEHYIKLNKMTNMSKLKRDAHRNVTKADKFPSTHPKHSLRIN